VPLPVIRATLLETFKDVSRACFSMTYEDFVRY
jgi:hypothetical protein